MRVVLRPLVEIEPGLLQGLAVRQRDYVVQSPFQLVHFVDQLVQGGENNELRILASHDLGHLIIRPGLAEHP